jgi:hypothetical protein
VTSLFQRAADITFNSYSPEKFFQACFVIPVYLNPLSSLSARHPRKVHQTKTSVIDRQDGVIAMQQMTSAPGQNQEFD